MISRADLENFVAETLSFLESSPSPRTFYSVVRALDQAGLTKHGLIDRSAVVEPLQIGDVHHGIVFLEDIGEAALRQTAMQRHLAAFKTALAAVARAGLLSLLATARRLAMSRSRSTADTLLGVPRAFFFFFGFRLLSSIV